MPKTKRMKIDRTGIRLPTAMIDEVDRIVSEYNAYTYPNRQQFIESAIREKIEKVRLVERGLASVDEQHQKQNLPRSHKLTMERDQEDKE